MTRTFKAHPLFILNLLKPFLFVLIFPLIKGLYQYLRYRSVDGILSLEIILFAIIFFIAFMRYRSIKINVHENRLSIKSGVLFIKKAAIKLSQVSCVKTSQSPLDAVFGAVTYRINTEAGKYGKPDFEFKLSRKDSERLSVLLYGNQGNRAVKFSLYKLAFLAATTSSAFTGIIISVPIINKLGNLLGIALNEMLFNEINTASEKMNNFFPPIVNIVTLILLAGYTVAFIYSLLKYINFRLFLERDRLEIRSGFLVRYRTAFKKQSIKNVTVEQTSLMRIFKRYSINISVGGYGYGQKERAVLVPCGRRVEIKSHFSAYFPFLKAEGKAIRPQRGKKNKRRFFFLPVSYLAVIFFVSVTLMVKFPLFQSLILFVAAVTASIVLYYTDLCLFNYRFGKLRFGEKNIYAQGSRGFNTCEFYCPKENVGEIKVIRYPNDLRFKTCKVKITVRSEGADSIRIKNLDYEKTLQAINKTFNINV